MFGYVKNMMVKRRRRSNALYKIHFVLADEKVYTVIIYEEIRGKFREVGHWDVIFSGARRPIKR